MCSAFGEPRVTTCVNVLNQNRNAALHDLDGNRWFCSGIAGAQPHTTKRLRLIAIRFYSKSRLRWRGKRHASIRRKIGSDGSDRSSEKQPAKDRGEVSGRQRQTETRRLVPSFRYDLSVRPHLRAKRLKTLELQINRILHSQIESSEYAMECRVVKRYQSDTRVSFCHAKVADSIDVRRQPTI